jgi:hypothetical protein
MIQVQEVTGTGRPHLGVVFGATEKQLCSYLIQSELLHKSKGTVESEKWERLVTVFVETEIGQRATRSRKIPESKVLLEFELSREGLAGSSSQTAQYYLTLSAPNATTKDKRKMSCLPPTIPLWPELANKPFAEPRLEKLLERREKKYAALGNPRPRLEEVKLDAGMKEKFASHFVGEKGLLVPEEASIKSKHDLTVIRFEDSVTKDLRLQLTLDLGKSTTLMFSPIYSQLLMPPNSPRFHATLVKAIVQHQQL